MKLSIFSVIGLAAMAIATPTGQWGIENRSENEGNVLVKRCSNYNATSACQTACTSIANNYCKSVCGGNPSCNSSCYSTRKRNCDNCCSSSCRTC